MPGRGFLFSGKQESRLAGSQVGKELGPVRAAHARQEAAAAWMDTRGDAVSSTRSLRTSCSAEQHWGASGGAEGVSASAQGLSTGRGQIAAPGPRLAQSRQRCRERATLSRLHFEWKLKSAVKQVQKSL